MKTKKVNRYYCDFCNKSGCNSGHIKAHEKKCCKNPFRICEMCDTPHRDYPDLVKRFEAGGGDTDALADWVDGCPWCMLAVHVGSGIPVDFFTATEENWFNYLVCRTGSAENNIEIAKAAQAKGWMWQPYGKGFIDKSGEWHQPKSEEEVFTLVGLPYLAPKDR